MRCGRKYRAVALASCLAVLATTPGFITTSGASATQSLHYLRLIVLAGQSNAEGYESYATPADGVSLLGTTTADRSVPFAFFGDYTSNVDTPPSVIDAPQVIAATGRRVFGPEIGMARYLWDHDHHHVAVEKVVRIGSSLSMWSPGNLLLTALTSRVDDLERWEQDHGRKTSVAAIVWVQGETESLGASAPTGYEAELSAFLPALRAAVGGSKTTPIVEVETSVAAYVNFQDYLSKDNCVPTSCANLFDWNKMVRRAQVAACKHVGHCYVVDDASYPRTGVQLHLDSQGELGLGRAIGKTLEHRL